ncbi:metallopeptidase family protein [Antricoccus suffuscus]|uniref:metallopeptidase family protein n=1 Tax=Antricoccus suffuscus TaxID=1629062 RepID=UPI00192D893F|nr:metallopeptidase family protein [Antricoccus suffuscus]
MSSSRGPRSYPARRDRRGRGVRGSLLPPGLPLSRSRAEAFDDIVLDAVESLEPRWGDVLEHVEFAVEDVPTVEHSTPDDVIHMPNVVEDSTVPLSRLIPGGVVGDGQTLPPRIVIYRRPLEVRGQSQVDLVALVHDIVVEQVASLLGKDPDEIEDIDGD